MEENTEDKSLNKKIESTEEKDVVLDKKMERTIKRKTKRELSKNIRNNKIKLFQIKMSKLIILLSEYTSEAEANITLSLNCQDRSAVLKVLKIQIDQIINEFKKDKSYLKNIKALYTIVSKYYPEELPNIRWIIDAVTLKEDHLVRRINTEFEVTSYAIKGFNYIPSNYEEDKSKEHNEEIEFRLAKTQEVFKDNKKS